MTYTNLVVEGGGTKGYSTIGCVQAFEEEKIIGNFENLIGTSAGSIMATLIAIGCSSSEMKKYHDLLDLSSFRIKYLSIRTYYNLIFKNGIHDPSKFEKMIGDVLRDKTGDSDITFKQVFEKYGKKLVITGTCLNKRTTHYYHHESNPDMQIKSAIKISCCIPLLFYPVRWKGDVLCDGAVLDNYPLYFFNNDTSLNSKTQVIRDDNEPINEKTIGIKFIDDNTTEKKLYTGNDNIKGIGSYLIAIINTFLTGMEQHGIKDRYWEKTIAINTGDYDSITDLTLTQTQKDTLIKAGYDSAINFLRLKK